MNVKELARIGRERFHITALTFGIERIKREARFARAGKTGDDHQLVLRQVEIDIFEVVLLCAADGNEFLGHESLSYLSFPRKRESP